MTNVIDTHRCEMTGKLCTAETCNCSPMPEKHQRTLERLRGLTYDPDRPPSRGFFTTDWRKGFQK